MGSPSARAQRQLPSVLGRKEIPNPHPRALGLSPEVSSTFPVPTGTTGFLWLRCPFPLPGMRFLQRFIHAVTKASLTTWSLTTGVLDSR